MGGDVNLHAALVPFAASWFAIDMRMDACMRDSDGDGKGYLELDG